MAATLAHRIKDLIGFDYTADEANMLTEDEALETACAEIIDTLPDSLLLKYAVAPTAIDSTDPDTDFASEGKRIIRVIRKDSNSIYRVCQEVDVDAFEEMKDTNSIYHPTRHSPIYTLDPVSGTTYLKILPTITGAADAANSASVYYITYPTGASIDSGESIAGLPNEVDHAIALKASLYILQTLISDAVQDEEDEEELSMLQVQAQSLAGMYSAEMARLANIEGEEAQQ
jgi:hypothetical protein